MDYISKNAQIEKDLPMESEKPTVTTVTPKAIAFYISSAVTVICMFLSWLSVDLDLGYIQFNSVLGDITIFNLPGKLTNINDRLEVLGGLLPESVAKGISAAYFVSIVVMLLGICAIGCYLCATVLRYQEDDRTNLFGKLAAMFAVLTVSSFVILICMCLQAMDFSNAIGHVLGKVITSPCILTLISALVSGVCSGINTGYKEDVVIYCDGQIKVDKGPKWKCNGCLRKNLSSLKYCYYCGNKKNSD